MRVYMVHWESGQYSDFTYAVCGVFSSREKAVAYLESLRVPVVWDDGMSYCDVVHNNFWKEIYDHHGEAKPTTKDGTTWSLMCGDMPAYGGCGCERTYYITEYELDEPRI